VVAEASLEKQTRESCDDVGTMTLLAAGLESRGCRAAASRVEQVLPNGARGRCVVAEAILEKQTRELRRWNDGASDATVSSDETGSELKSTSISSRVSCFFATAIYGGQDVCEQAQHESP
jgi:hypothetical protein